MTDGRTFTFFGYLKGLFRKSEANGAAEEAPPIEPAPPPKTLPSPPPAARASLAGNGGVTLPPRRQTAALQIPLQAILAGLQLELKAKVRQEQVGDLTISVPLEKVLSQLAHGAVRIPFGDIRQEAPQVFAAGADFDRIPVLLPLNEILSQLNPALLVRRVAQKQVEVPADITSPFDGKGQGLFFSVGNAKPVTPAAPRQAAPAPALPARGSISSMPAAALPAATVPMRNTTPAPAPVAPRMPITPIAPATPIAPTMPPAPVIPTLPTARTVPPAVSAPAAPPPAPARPAADTGSLLVALKSVAEEWPESLRQEIVQTNLVNARLSLPCELMETALKRGRAAFPWKTLRGWITPAPAPTVSAYDNTELELPLKVIAPLFLARQSASAKHHQKVTIDEGIPNLFFGFPKPDAPPHTAASPVNKPVDTNYYVWDDNAETARIEETEYRRKTPTGTDFVSRYATPNEIVSRAAALDGVAGALIALPDGLMVANRIPAEQNGDTLAAFLPQIFAKVSQCTKELRMGELNNLNFTVGNVPWKIFRVNAIFFAAFGRAGEPLPTGQLAALAAELDRKNK